MTEISYRMSERDIKVKECQSIRRIVTRLQENERNNGQKWTMIMFEHLR